MDNHIFAFHKTVIGYGHIQEEIPCEDASVSYVSDDGNFQIIVVGDGHGDPACHRSAQGSKLVIAAALQCLREFAQAICAGTVDISTPEQQEYYMKLLTHAIISQWYGAVRRNLLEHEMGEDDFREAGRYEKAYRQGSYLEHLYGKYGTISEWKKIKKYCPVKGWVLNKKDSYKLLLINCEAVIRL